MPPFFYTLCTQCTEQFQIDKDKLAFDIKCPLCSASLKVGYEAYSLATSISESCPTANVFIDYRGSDDWSWYWQVRDQAKARCPVVYHTVCQSCKEDTLLPSIKEFSPFCYHTGRMDYCQTCFAAIYYDPDFEDIWAEYEETFVPYFGREWTQQAIENTMYVKTSAKQWTREEVPLDFFFTPHTPINQDI